ncbi:hypothetical protein IHO13_04355 [Wolbachia endosymbiont of Mansonella perstans]|nr:hypothetical protein [Wolbachia endosymbiont of Mansonella perstans]
MLILIQKTEKANHYYTVLLIIMIAFFVTKKATELLLEYKVDPNARDNQGKTLLHCLREDHSYLNNCARGHVEIAKLLLRKGANPDLKDDYNKNSIGYAKHDSKVDSYLVPLIMIWS